MAIGFGSSRFVVAQEPRQCRHFLGEDLRMDCGWQEGLDLTHHPKLGASDHDVGASQRPRPLVGRPISPRLDLRQVRHFRHAAQIDQASRLGGQGARRNFRAAQRFDSATLGIIPVAVNRINWGARDRSISMGIRGNSRVRSTTACPSRLAGFPFPSPPPPPGPREPQTDAPKISGAPIVFLLALEGLNASETERAGLRKIRGRLGPGHRGPST